MTELSLPEVEALRAHRIEVRVDVEVLHRDRDRIFERLQEDAAKRVALVSGHQVSAEEFQTETKVEYRMDNTRAIRHRWAPEKMGYTEAELIGGPDGGLKMHLPAPLPDVIRTPDKRPQPVTYYRPDDPPPTYTPHGHHLYDHAGWNTDTKRHIYRYHRPV